MKLLLVRRGRQSCLESLRHSDIYKITHMGCNPQLHGHTNALEFDLKQTEWTSLQNPPTESLSIQVCSWMFIETENRWHRPRPQKSPWTLLVQHRRLRPPPHYRPCDVRPPCVITEMVQTYKVLQTTHNNLGASIQIMGSIQIMARESESPWYTFGSRGNSEHVDNSHLNPADTSHSWGVPLCHPRTSDELPDCSWKTWICGKGVHNILFSGRPTYRSVGYKLYIYNYPKIILRIFPLWLDLHPTRLMPHFSNTPTCAMVKPLYMWYGHPSQWESKNIGHSRKNIKK